MRESEVACSLNIEISLLIFGSLYFLKISYLNIGLDI